MTAEDLARKLYDVCTKDGKNAIIHDIDIVHNVTVARLPLVAKVGDCYHHSFDILLDDARWLRVTVSELDQ